MYSRGCLFEYSWYPFCAKIFDFWHYRVRMGPGNPGKALENLTEIIEKINLLNCAFC